MNLAVDTATLDESPGFDRGNPPDHADGTLLRGPPRARTTRVPATEGDAMGETGDAISYVVLALGFVVLTPSPALFFVQAMLR